MTKDKTIDEINRLLSYYQSIETIQQKNQTLALAYEENKPKSKLKYWFIIIWLITSIAIYYTGDTSLADVTAHFFIILLCVLFGFVAGASVVIISRFINDVTLRGDKKTFVSTFKSQMEENFSYVKSFAQDIASNSILPFDKTSTKQLILLKEKLNDSFGLQAVEEAKETIIKRELTESEIHQIEVIEYFAELNPRDTSITKLIKASKFKIGVDE